MNFFMISFSFIVSTICSILILKNRRHKWLSISSAFLINLLILSTAIYFLFILDEESRVFGADFNNRYMLLISIPLITWLNYIILLFENSRIKK